MKRRRGVMYKRTHNKPTAAWPLILTEEEATRVLRGAFGDSARVKDFIEKLKKP